MFESFSPSFDLEKQYEGVVIGIDEAGMGCWAGHVFAAAVWIPFETDEAFLAELNDSKKLTAEKRRTLFTRYEAYGLKMAIGEGSLEEIETLNIRGAALKAMERAYQGLGVRADMALVDGTMSPKIPCLVRSIIKGDQQSYSIAAASIAAKVCRDDYMKKLAAHYPHYGWEKNAGYGTRAHQEALALHGVTPHHRASFAPIKKILEEGALAPSS